LRDRVILRCTALMDCDERKNQDQP
jgi:hypothetical protein